MLILENVIKSFPQMPDPVLKGINLTIDQGEYCIILGSNGSGKSTLLKAISGEYQIDSGKVSLGSKNITKQPIHTRAEYISSVAQDIAKGTIQDMTLLENIALSRIRGKKASYQFYKNQAEHIENDIKLLDLGLEKFLHSNMSSLSGGQRQSIATLMAMIPEPTLLLLDEHTSALDPRSREKVMGFTDRYIKQHKLTTLMITHNIEDAVKYGSRLIIMHHGEIIHDIKGQDKSTLTAHKILEILHEIGDTL